MLVLSAWSVFLSPFFSNCSICFFAPLGEDQVPSVWSCEPSCGTLCPQHRTARNQPYSKDTSQGNTIYNFFHKLRDFTAFPPRLSWCYCSFVIRACNETLLSHTCTAVGLQCTFVTIQCMSPHFCRFWRFVTVWLTVTAAFLNAPPHQSPAATRAATSSHRTNRYFEWITTRERDTHSDAYTVTAL